MSTIEQKPKFQTITIVLDNKSDAEALWKVVDTQTFDDHLTKEEEKFLRYLSNWFSNTAQLGG